MLVRHRAWRLALLVLLALAPAVAPADSLDRIARHYVHLTLEIGERDPGYVDAYYGPSRWRRQAHAHPRTLAELAAAAEALKARVAGFEVRQPGLERRRKAFL